jgi:prepilin-type N-terminal cleavage/methylation domain-containing protein/prepilin-type processing-associated H-X9-DG protein
VLGPRNLIRDSARLYGLLLCLYPARFRRAFGGPMRDVFEQWLADEAARDGLRGIGRVWRTTLAEFIPTLIRECADAFAAAHPGQAAAALLRRLPRLLMACLLPAGAYIALLRFLAHSDGSLVIAAWFTLMAIGMARARGRGWACNRNAMLAAAVGVALPLLWAGMTTVSTPSLFFVAPLLIAAAATIGLILSTYVRLVMEGLTLSAAGAIPMKPHGERPRGTCKSLGFSLPELLVVIGIIALLIAILLPVIGAARKTARDTACLANLHEWGRSFQMYLDSNRGKSFVERQDLTDLAWFELLQAYNGDLTRTLLCPDATEPGNVIGSASHAWGPERTYVTAAPKWEVRGTFVGSYGFNAWLWRLRAGPTYPADLQARFIELHAAQHADAVPILADCIEQEGRPLDTDTVPTNLQQPLPTSGSGIPGPTGFMAYFCIDRHRRAVNAVFLDGHAARVPLQELWKLQWNRTFTSRDVVLPP